jgi:Methyltransferase domain
MQNRSLPAKKPAQSAPKKGASNVMEQLGLREGQSLELLQALHILTRDGAINQDSRRKLKQVNHLLQFIEPLLAKVQASKGSVTLVDHGAGKSYLGFMLYDLFFKAGGNTGKVIGMEFLNLSVTASNAALPSSIDIV